MSRQVLLAHSTTSVTASGEHHLHSMVTVSGTGHRPVCVSRALFVMFLKRGFEIGMCDGVCPVLSTGLNKSEHTQMAVQAPAAAVAVVVAAVVRQQLQPAMAKAAVAQ